MISGRLQRIHICPNILIIIADFDFLIMGFLIHTRHFRLRI